MLDSLQYINSQLVNRVTVITTSALHILALEYTVGDSDVGQPIFQLVSVLLLLVY